MNDTLRKAARAETARVYGTVQREHRRLDDLIAQAEAAIARFEAKPRTRKPRTARPDTDDATRERIEQALARGRSLSWIIDALGVDYATVWATRKRLMAGAA